MSTKYGDEFKAEILAVYASEGRAVAVRRFENDERGHPAGNTIKRWADEQGVVCAHTTKAETEAANAVQAVKRAQLKVKLLDLAAEMLDRMREPMKTWVGSGATPFEVELDRPPSSVCREFATAAGILVDKLRLEAGEATDRHEFSGPDGGPIEFAEAATSARKRLAGTVSRIAARQRAEGVPSQPE